MSYLCLLTYVWNKGVLLLVGIIVIIIIIIYII